MNKKVAILPFAVAGALLIGCSDKAEESNPVTNPILGQQDPATTPYIDPVTGDYVNPETGEVIPTVDYVNPETGETVPGIQVTDPETGETVTVPVVIPDPVSSASQQGNEQPGVSSASTDPATNPTDPQNPNQSPVNPTSSAEVLYLSSSSLKEYDDNHKAKATFLPKAGFYSNLTIEPPTPQKGGQIKCTFDGSFPTQNSESITQATPITQNTVIRCSEFVNGQPADTTTQTYFIGENVSMPVVALTVNHYDMFDSSAGLYATGDLTNSGGMGMWGGVGGDDTNNPKCAEPCKQANFWRDDELPVHVEYFENGSSTNEKTWEIDAGISIIGNYSRYKPKKSVAIKMDNDDYGDKVLKYSFFKTRPEAKKMKSFNLRNNGNRFWTDYFGDPMLVSLMEGTDVDYQRSLQVVVFYNGEYFGIHDLRERLNRSYVETNYGIDSKSINVVKNCANGDQGCVNGWAPSGTNGASSTEFGQLANSITGGNFAGENNQSYAEIKTKLNVNSFAQYMIAEMYIHNGDWPNNNIRAWGSPQNGYPFKFMIFDVDHGYGFTPGIMGFDTESQNMFQWVLGSATDNSQGGQQPGGQQPGGMGGIGGIGGGWGGGFGMGGANTTIGNMLKKLLANPEFKHLFINQGCILLNDYLTYEKVQKAVQTMAAMIPSSEQSRDEQRWPRTQAKYNWSPSGADILRFAQNRTETFRQELATYFGLQGETTVSISASGSGTILVDGMKLPSSNYQGKFFTGVDMVLTAIPETGRVFSGWADGNTENPRKVQIANGATYSAIFK
ncbi:Chitobiase/beta-hexosaminidase C-terminal domain-containing protein [Fibrobacter sp. UWT2]|uniref:CotH kinase family protein n=1 Tax=Fibrobacter sp. UWT2 TaxID=1896224 RepID=UPI00092400D8|nr:CotH kinase family protein [Fibrobacter sp. UWT2]SHK90302.1 Chitobiase/beta-hexosaminidase C-terminal domain-containing protein [Fibrobacter sp. UWT2]